MDRDLTQLLGGVVDKVVDFLPAEKIRRGNPGYPVASHIACFLVMFLKGLESERDLAEYLKNHKELLPVLKLPRAPVATTLGRFRRRFGTEKLSQIVDTFGIESRESDEVVTDSSLQEKNDQEAEWGYSDSKGWILGYKTHVCCDAKTGLPIKVITTTANRHDCPMLPKLINGLDLNTVIGDAGYDSEANIKLVYDMNATPAIAFNKRAEKGKGFSKTNSLRHKARKNKKRKKLLRKRYIVEQLNNLIHEILDLKNRSIKGLEACSFYAQLAALSLLAQAHWAQKRGLTWLKRQIKYFRRR
jgi:IS5 family transposase